MSYLKDFQTRILKNDSHEFLKLWEEYCYSDEVDSKELVQILKDTKNSPLSSFFTPS